MRAAAAIPIGVGKAGEVAASAQEHVYPRWPWSWPVRSVRAVWIELLLRPLVWVLGAPRVMRAAEELPKGPVLIVANHVTAYDGALVLYALPGRVRRVWRLRCRGRWCSIYGGGGTRGTGF